MVSCAVYVCALLMIARLVLKPSIGLTILIGVASISWDSLKIGTLHLSRLLSGIGVFAGVTRTFSIWQFLLLWVFAEPQNFHLAVNQLISRNCHFSMRLKSNFAWCARHFRRCVFSFICQVVKAGIICEEMSVFQLIYRSLNRLIEMHNYKHC